MLKFSVDINFLISDKKLYHLSLAPLRHIVSLVMTGEDEREEGGTIVSRYEMNESEFMEKAFVFVKDTNHLVGISDILRLWDDVPQASLQGDSR